MTPRLDLSLTVGRFGRGLAKIICVLGVMNAIALTLKYGLDHPRAFGFVWMFAVGGEHNVPALFSTSLMFLIAVIAFVLARAHQRNGLDGAMGWLLIGVIFVFLGIDETAMIHEKLAQPLRESLGVGGIFYFAWIIPYTIAVGVLAVVYLPFVWRLPPRSRNLVVLAAAVYLSSAVGMEAINGAYFETMEDSGIVVYALMVMVEELGEMAGLAIFLCAQIDYALTRFDPVSLRFVRAAGA